MFNVYLGIVLKDGMDDKGRALAIFSIWASGLEEHPRACP